MAKSIKTVSFFSQFNRPKKVIPVYNPEIPVTTLTIVGDCKRVKVTGKTNFQDKLEASCPFHTVKQLVARFQRGDVTALNGSSGFFADVTGMPTNILEAHKLASKTLDYYNSLDGGLRKAFGSYNDFVRSFGDNSFNKIVGDYYASKKIRDQAVAPGSVSPVSNDKEVPAKEKKQTDGGKE